MDVNELANILEKLKRLKPDIYRHIVGMVKAVLAAK